MLEIHHFSYGPVTPAVAYLMSFTGSLLGLQCAARARGGVGSRIGWLCGAAVAIGGTGIWVMHFIAMLGFSIGNATIRYDVPLTLLSALTAIGVVGVGLFVVGVIGAGEPRMVTLVPGGALTGAGVAAMHYTGMAAMRTDARLTYNPVAVAMSVLVAVVASTVALWFTLRVKRLATTVGAALIMAVAVCGMHFTGMAAIHADTVPHATAPSGAGASDLLAPLIALVSLTTTVVLLHVVTTDDSEYQPASRPRPESHARHAAEKQ
ncbi:MAG: hypothetical protein HOQ24_10770 [Mycobacteriaceae bacterium]|nr:hypothetical protein [Mycobacteriaceae bacterium]